MSIIHNALKSVRQKMGPEAGRKRPVLLWLLFLATAAFYLHVQPLDVPLLVAENSPELKTQPAQLRLNGVFVSDRLKVAMINSHIYRKGETVNGMKITAIELNRVSLDHDGTELVLKMT